MSNKIIIKHRHADGNAPAVGDLEVGELALNFVTKTIYTKGVDTSGSNESIMELGSAFGAVLFQGEWDPEHNTPTLPTPDPTNKGFYWIANAAGTHNSVQYFEGDLLISSGDGSSTYPWHHIQNVSNRSGVEVASLVGGKVPLSQLPDSIVGGMKFMGTWDASGTSDPSATPEVGQYWIVNVAGTHPLDGISEWSVGDWAVYLTSGTGAYEGWDKIDHSPDLIADQIAFTPPTGMSSTDVQAAIEEVNTTASSKQDSIGTGSDNQVLKMDGTSIIWETQIDDDITSHAGITGASNVKDALINLDPRAHAYSSVTATPVDGVGNDGDLYSYTDNVDVANSAIYQKVNGHWETITAGPGAASFLNLSDTPTSYAGKDGYFPHVVEDTVTPSNSKLDFTNTIDGGTY